MKRDMSLIREILLRLEALEKPTSAVLLISPHDVELQFADRSADDVEYQMTLIWEAGLVEILGANGLSGDFRFRRLSWSGHDFVDAVRDPEIWRKTQRELGEARSFTVELLKDLAKGFIKKQLEERTGVQL